jgi:RNA polymerase sigma factor (TIGR02999 family)
MPPSPDPSPEHISSDELFEFVYEELKRMARRHLRGSGSKLTISTTELVHESFLKLRATPAFHGRAHFFGAAARAMREVLVDFARHARAEKRGGDYTRISLSDAEADTDAGLELQLDEMLALDEALNRLSMVDQRLTQIVELRFFCGLGEQEIAEVLGVTTRTVERNWLKARLVLLKALEPARGDR